MGVKPSLFQVIDRSLAALARLCVVISGLCLVTLVTTFGWLVYGRYVLNATPTWVEQLSLLLVVVITFLSAAVGVRDNTHLSVEILPNALSAAWRSRLAILINLILIGFGLLMALNAYTLTSFTWGQEIPLLNVPEGLRSLPMVISGALMTLFAAGNIARELDPARAGAAAGGASTKDMP